MKYGYCRVANNSENSLEAQKQTMQREMCDEIITEVRSGNKEPSDVFVNLLNRLEKDDTLVVTGIDRLSRSIRYSLEITNQLFKKGIKIHALDTGFVEAKDLDLLSTITEATSRMGMDREILSSRIKQGKAFVRKRREDAEGQAKIGSNESYEQ